MTTQITKIQKLAHLAKLDGYDYIASIVKTVYATTYYHVLPIDAVIESGWQGAPRDCASWRGAVGQRHLPPKTILRKKLYKQYADADKAAKKTEAKKTTEYKKMTTKSLYKSLSIGYLRATDEHIAIETTTDRDMAFERAYHSLKHNVDFSKFERDDVAATVDLLVDLIVAAAKDDEPKLHYLINL